MPSEATLVKKRAYANKFVNLINENNNILIVHADNVSSNQFQQIRRTLRGQAEVLMGKNTTIRKVLKDFLRSNPSHPVSNLVPYVEGNVGFIFTNSDVTKIRDVVVENKVPAPARVGSLAPEDVFVEPGPTGCDPGQTSWFQALNIPTKINKGQIEMIARVHLIKAGDKVLESQSALLQKLNVKPFSYSLVPKFVYQNGNVFDADILDITDADMISKFLSGARLMAALGLELGVPSKASFTHSVNNAYKALLSIGMGTDYKFGAVKAFEDFIKNGPAVSAAATGGAAAAAVVEESSEEEESAGGAGGLFGDDEEDDW
jgi:large subunit ribosomal protein LP0